jgi:hypothetical protein
VKSSEKACAFTGKKARRGAGGAAPAASAASVYQLSCQPPRALGAPGTLFRPVSLERSPAVVLWRAPTPPGPLGPLACLARDREGSSPASGTRVRGRWRTTGPCCVSGCALPLLARPRAYRRVLPSTAPASPVALARGGSDAIQYALARDRDSRAHHLPPASCSCGSAFPTATHATLTRRRAAQDEFALETIPNADGQVGFVSANQADGSVYCDFLDGERAAPRLILR